MPRKRINIDQIKRDAAIDFSNWQLGGDCEYSATDEDEWTHNYDCMNRLTTDELYDVYLKQQENHQTPEKEK